jgi:hypothetical protein
MSQGSKSAYYQALKEHGYPFDKHYRVYSTDELRALYDGAGLPPLAPEVSRDAPPPYVDQVAEINERLDGFAGVLDRLINLVTAGAPEPAPQGPPTYLRQTQQPVAPPQPQRPTIKPAPQGLDPTQHAGVLLNTHGPNDIVSVDEFGNQWYQPEVTKPGYARPRGRRIYTEVDSGTQIETVRTSNGDFETFEIPGDPKFAKTTETKITLPSFQTGIYKAPGVPFKIHIYQGNKGFDYDDVNRFYSGADMVPDTIKRVYVSTDLCYDIATVIRAVKDEERELRLKGQM